MQEKRDEIREEERISQSKRSELSPLDQRMGVEDERSGEKDIVCG